MTTLTVLYDNRTTRADLKPDWGFSCFIEGLEDVILFDTGGDGATLLMNAAAIGADLKRVDTVVISHAHDDHAGGLADLLDASGTGKRVVLLESFPERLAEAARAGGANVVYAASPFELCAGARTSGELGEGDGIREQCLVLEDRRGVAVITGCAHPGIVGIVETLKETTGQPVTSVLGGFHLFRESAEAADDVASRLRDLGVERVAPCHCTGEVAIERFAYAYEEGFVRCEAGAVMKLGA
ncbi:MAG: MBL fold metallo-hydrolase [Candidatus Eisenbacteria bacterium]|nr:MBL fold metallo-hydrolase [Candidatus Eisenbacteria bacterium]